MNLRIYFGKILIFNDLNFENSIICGRYAASSWCGQVMGVLEVGGNQ